MKLHNLNAGLIVQLTIKTFVFLSSISILVVLTLIVCSYARAGQKTLESKSDLQGELVQVSGGSYRNILSEQLWAMLQKKDFVLINVHIPKEGG